MKLRKGRTVVFVRDIRATLAFYYGSLELPLAEPLPDDISKVEQVWFDFEGFTLRFQQAKNDFEPSAPVRIDLYVDDFRGLDLDEGVWKVGGGEGFRFAVGKDPDGNMVTLNSE